MEIDISYIKAPRKDGWGFLPPSQEVFDILIDVKEKTMAKKIMEIGFNAGHSSIYLLNIFPDAELHVIGPSPKHGNQNVIRGKFDDRFKFYQMRTDQLRDTGFKEKFDLGFIDGHHSSALATIDLDYCINDLKCEYLVLDNYEQNGVKNALSLFKEDIKQIKKYSYINTWKGETKNLEMALYYVSRNRF
jgi:predicted O-methyltransferase YrrM